MVYIGDLKSLPVMACGFESHPRHHKKTLHHIFSVSIMAEIKILIEGYAKKLEKGFIASSTVCLITT